MDDFRLTATPAIANPPVEIGATRLAGIDPGGVHTLVLRPDDPEALTEDVERLIAPLPPIGRSTSTPGGATLLRLSRERAYLIGGPPATGQADSFYALDQSAFWAVLELTGPGAQRVLERNWKPDLAEQAFPDGAVARSTIAQVPTILWCTDAQSYRLMAPRSYARTLFHELETSLRWVL